MLALVTGGAGSIGSHLVEHLQALGNDVRVVDRVDDSGSSDAPLERLAGLGVEVQAADPARARLEPLLDGVDTVLHLAARPGIRRSWSDGFSAYADDNIVATHRLLEAIGSGPAQRSPYGVTKLTLIDRVETLVGHPLPVDLHDRAAGDVTRTLGDGSRAARHLGWWPEVDLDHGLKQQLAWHEEDRP